jgi:hypothetical protein
LSSGCSFTLIGGIIGGNTAPTIEDSNYPVTFKELEKLSSGTHLVVYTIEGIIFEGKYAGSSPLDSDVPLSGVTIRRKNREIVIPWRNIERIEAKKREVKKSVTIGALTGAALDVVAIILIITNWKFDDFSPDWGGM